MKEIPDLIQRIFCFNRTVTLANMLGADLVIPTSPEDDLSEDLSYTKAQMTRILSDLPAFDLVLRSSDLLSAEFCSRFTQEKDGASPSQESNGLVVTCGAKDGTEITTVLTFPIWQDYFFSLQFSRSASAGLRVGSYRGASASSSGS